ncbi:hypothetical protein RchiOBHm_Chr3g0466611 [Rosa chinensis]|uniref:Uncharacterized protein n=1 Tax=Rosa chinensis TaxID=74649 RepID=A0A2P6RA08_ROSCH|nr:hypothetical protein RchiOBHm_Chr3g0466611 [Rosa chinensis]
MNELRMWSLESRKQASRMVMEDDAHGNSSSPLALLEMLNALEDGEKMERKWRDKEDEMDEGIGFESERRSVFIAQKMMNGGWR